MDRIELVQNDTGPQILLTLVDTATSAPLDLTGAELVLNFGMLGQPIKAVVPLVPGPNAAAGQCMLDWVAAPPGVLDTPGRYEGEVQITWPTGRIQTTPQKIKFRVRQEIA